MHAIRVLAVAAMLGAPAAHAADDADDWKLIGGILAIVQQVVHQAATSPDPAAAQKSMEAILSGGNEQANRIAAGVLPTRCFRTCRSSSGASSPRSAATC